MRRYPIALAGLMLIAATGGCSRHNTVTNSATAPAGFVPPTALNRTDFANLVNTRFQQLDVNHDSVISKAELPVRHHDLIASFDTNGDGKITRDEFTTGSLAKFKAADLNDDDVLTGEERRSAELGTDVSPQEEDAGNKSAPNGR
jgi:hypothetical protein